MLVLAAVMRHGACMGIVMPKSLGMLGFACMGVVMPKSLGMLGLASGMWPGACMGIVMPKSLAGMLMLAAGMLVLAAGFGDGPGVAILGLSWRRRKRWPGLANGTARDVRAAFACSSQATR